MTSAEALPDKEHDRQLQLQGVNIDISAAVAHVALYEGRSTRITVERYVAYIQVAVWHNRIFLHYQHQLNSTEGLAQRRAMNELLQATRTSSTCR